MESRYRPAMPTMRWRLSLECTVAFLLHRNEKARLRRLQFM